MNSLISREYGLVINVRQYYPHVYALFSFLLSIYILPFYVGGDQKWYCQFYDNISSYDFANGFLFYKNILGTAEPGYFLLGYFFSELIDKTLLMSLINAILAYRIGVFLVSCRVPSWMFFLLTLNYYQLVLFFSAERLKLACLLFILGFSSLGVFKYIFQAIGVFCHAQLLPIAFGGVVTHLFNQQERGRVFAKAFSLLFILLLLLLVYYFLNGHVNHKLESAHASTTLNEVYVSLFKGGVLLVLSIYYAGKKNRATVLWLQLPIIALIALIGGSRLDILLYFIFFYFAIQVSKGVNWGIIITSGYFFLNGVNFLTRIIETGNGY